MPASASSPETPQQRQRWRCSRRITLALLAIWFGVSFGVAYFARELNAAFFGWPFSFWVGAQGALLVYLALVCLYAALMNRHDAASDAGEAG